MWRRAAERPAPAGRGVSAWLRVRLNCHKTLRPGLEWTPLGKGHLDKPQGRQVRRAEERKGEIRKVTGDEGGRTQRAFFA